MSLPARWSPSSSALIAGVAAVPPAAFIEPGEIVSRRAGVVAATVGVLRSLWIGVTAIVLLTASALGHLSAVLIVLVLISLLVAAVRATYDARELDVLRSEVDTDRLTSLSNHGHFHELLRAKVGSWQEGDDEIVVLLGDLDGFKAVNDRLGHLHGDEVLRQASGVLRRCFGGQHVARLGGDEFGVVLTGVGREDAQRSAGRAAAEIASLADGLGISWGVAALPSDGVTALTLVHTADRALYEAKQVLDPRRQRRNEQLDDEQRPQLEAYARDVRIGYARERRKARDLNESYLATVTALAAAVEAKDDTTGGHIHRVHALGLLLAEIVCPADLKDAQLGYGFLLHDIGKLAVPDAVLMKPGKLDAQEWEVMRSHAVAGVGILASVPFLQRALDVVRHHHERWDGGGYPDGLAGEEIPVWARLFAVVDTLDAMTADRPYRRGLPLEDAMAEIVAHSGRQFDPTCVQALLALEPSRILPLLETQSRTAQTAECA